LPPARQRDRHDEVALIRVAPGQLDCPGRGLDEVEVLCGDPHVVRTPGGGEQLLPALADVEVRANHGPVGEVLLTAELRRADADIAAHARLPILSLSRSRSLLGKPG